jgi:hypothetical protein
MVYVARKGDVSAEEVLEVLARRGESVEVLAVDAQPPKESIAVYSRRRKGPQWPNLCRGKVVCTDLSRTVAKALRVKGHLTPN